MYIVLLGVIGCFTYTLTQAPFSEFLSSSNIDYTWAPLIALPYFLRFSWDLPLYKLFSKINSKFLHKEMLIGLSLLLLCSSTLLLLGIIAWYVHALIFTTVGASQSNIIESYKITVKKKAAEVTESNKQTSWYLFGYRGSKIIVSPFIYFVTSFLSVYSSYSAYCIAFFLLTVVIVLFSVTFYFIGEKTGKYESKLSILDIKNIKEVFDAIKEKQSYVIFFNTVFFRFADSMVSSIYLIFLFQFMTSGDYAFQGVFIGALSLLGLLIAYYFKAKLQIHIKNLLLITGVLQTLTFLLFIFLIPTSLYIITAYTVFKIFGIFATDIIATFMRSNAAHTVGYKQSAYILSESFYRLFSCIAGFAGSLLYYHTSANTFFTTCLVVSIIPTIIFIKYRHRVLAIC
jgi:hypothetical protein